MQRNALKILILVLIPLIVYVAPLPFTPLMEPDEGRYSAIPSEMNATGDYVTPRLKGAVYFEKPPLAYWATALLFKLLGEHEFSSRLFAALCAWGCILLTYRMGVFFHDSRTGLYAAAVLTTFLYHAAIGRINILDMPLAYLVCLAAWAGFRYGVSAQKRPGWLYLMYLTSALAFLAKGLIGVVFPFGIVAVWMFASRRWREVFSLISPVGALLFAAVALPWLILVQQANPDFFRFFFIQEHLLRYATKMHDRYQPVYFYVPIILAGTLPWCAFLPQALRGLSLRAVAGLFGSDEKRLLLSWFGVVTIFFSLSSSKLIPYIAPAFLPLALLFGHVFRSAEDRTEPSGGALAVPLRYRVTAVLQSLLFMAVLIAPLFLPQHRVELRAWWPLIAVPLILMLLMLFLPGRLRGRVRGGWFLALHCLFALFILSVTVPVSAYLAPYKSAYPLARAIQAQVPANEMLYQYGMSLYGIDFYTGRRTPIVDDIGEITYGSRQLPPEERERYFLYSDTFFPFVRQQTSLYCATERDKLERLKKEVPGLTVLWHNNFFYLLKLN